MRRILFLVLALAASPASAQQQQPTPAETALQIDAVINAWAQTITQQAKLIEQLQKQLADEKAKTPKDEPPK